MATATVFNTSEDDALNFAGDDVFLNVRDTFAALGYNESNIRDRYIFLGTANEAFVIPKFTERTAGAISGLDVLMHLFMGQESIPIDDVVRLLGSHCFSDLQELKLILLEKEGATCRATVRIEPVDDLLSCSDRISRRSDFVYRPWDYSAKLYQQIIPQTKCGSFLEMCCGSAYVCMAAARNFAQSVHGVDVNPRAIRFAEFNKKLNGIENISTYCGNLFEPVQSKVFDRIVAHPPYVPAIVDSLTYRDGGIDGERVSTDLIRGIPRHLADGGAFHAYLGLSDRLDAPAELRVREMLGADHQEFDVALLLINEQSLLSWLARGVDPNPFSEENERLRDACRKLGIIRFFTAILTVRSRRGSSPATYRHRAFSSETVAAMANPMTFTS